MKLSEKQVQDFMEQLYKNGDTELKELFKHQYGIKGAILSEVANIMLIYIVENDVIKMSAADQQKEMKKLSNIINSYMKADAEIQIAIISGLLANTTKDTFRLYSYNAKKKEIEKILKESFKGKHFSDRVWENENEVARYMQKQIEEFLKGKVSVNKIKNNVEGLFNTSAYNAKRLTETEISRCASSAFNRFGEEVGIKKVRYNAILDSKTCEDCSQYDGKIYDFSNKLDLPRHPMCRCYYDIVE